MAMQNTPSPRPLWDPQNMQTIEPPENQRTAKKLLLYGAGGILKAVHTSRDEPRRELAGMPNRDAWDVELVPNVHSRLT